MKPLIIRSVQNAHSSHNFLSGYTTEFDQVSGSRGKIEWSFEKAKAKLFDSVAQAREFLKSINHSGVGVEIVYHDQHS